MTGTTARNWLYKLVVFVIFVVALVVAIAVLVVAPPLGRWGLWAIIMFAVLVAAARFGTNWGWFGALVDPKRGKYSLGQLQLVAWTILVLSAWVGIVFSRIILEVPDTQAVQAVLDKRSEIQTALEDVSLDEATKKKKTAQLDEVPQKLADVLKADVTFDQALNVEIPVEVLILLGISAGSLVAGATIKSEKPHLDNANALKDPPDPDVPKWTDIFKGDQTGDKDYIDIGKFQMFWFTVAALVAYGMQIYAAIDLAATNEALKMLGLTGDDLLKAGFALLDSMPAVHASLAGVLGVSHLGYLANKIPERQ